MKIPAMGFSDYFIQTVTTDALPSTTTTTATTTTAAASAGASGAEADDVTDGAASAQKSDQEILESIEDCYYDADSNLELYELKVSIAEGRNMKIPYINRIVNH